MARSGVGVSRRDGLGPEFGALLVAATVTNIGDGIRLAALPLVAASLTDSAFLIAAVTAAQFLPWLVWAPFGGVIVDRSDRRRLILVTQTWRAAVMALLMLALLFDVAAIWQVFVVAFVITVGEILVDPSVVATVPTLVERRDLDRANGRLSVVETLTNEFLGGPLGALTYSIAPWLPFLIDSGSYLGSTGPFRKLPATGRVPRSGPAPAFRDELAEGLRWIMGHRFLRPWTAAVAVFNIGSAAAFSLLVVLVLETIDASEIVFGVTLAGAALGGAAGSGVASRLVDRWPRRTVMTVGAVIVSVSVAVAGQARAPWQLVAAWTVYGLASGVLLAIGRGFVQRFTPQEVLGRTAIASRTITRTAFVVGALASGAVATGTTVRVSFEVAAVVQLLGAVLMWHSLGRDPER